MTMKCNKILGILLILIFLIVFFSCSYFFLKDFFELKENNEDTEKLIDDAIEIITDIEDKNIKASINWDYLKSINENIIGWIEIEDTNINYPILKDNDNLYYLKHSYNKKYNSNGSIFTLDDKPFEIEETLIYGHNMRKNKSMFSQLGNYLDKDFLYSHRNIKIYTPSQNYIGEIFSCYSIGMENENANIKSLDFNEKIKYYKSSSKYKMNSTDNINKIIKLSTCSYINARTHPTNQRYYIIANIIPIE